MDKQELFTRHVRDILTDEFGHSPASAATLLGEHNPYLPNVFIPWDEIWSEAYKYAEAMHDA